MSGNYYEILGVSKDCSQEEIEKAYKKLALRYHPDRNPGDNEAAEKFLEVQKAFDTLKDPSKRQGYDNPQPQINFPFGNPFNIHPEVFEQEDLDIRLVCHISLSDSVKGAIKPISYFRKASCNTCSGSGHSDFRACPVCSGRGVVINSVNNLFKFQTLCGNCLGRGKMGLSKCGICRGTKYTEPQESKVNLQIPRGAQHGMTLCMHNQGNIGLHNRIGNVYIEMALVDDANYRLNGLDITSTYHANFSTLLFGGKVEIPTLDDDVIEIDVPPKTKCGTKFRIKEKGLPDFRNNQIRGDLVANVLVDIPNIDDVNIKNLLMSHGL